MESGKISDMIIYLQDLNRDLPKGRGKTPEARKSNVSVPGKFICANSFKSYSCDQLHYITGARTLLLTGCEDLSDKELHVNITGRNKSDLN